MFEPGQKVITTRVDKDVNGHLPKGEDSLRHRAPPSGSVLTVVKVDGKRLYCQWWQEGSRNRDWFDSNELKAAP